MRDEPPARTVASSSPLRHSVGASRRTKPAKPSAAARTGPVPRWLARPLEPFYAAAVRRRNTRFDRGLGAVDVGRPVISIGNLSVGGTGKSPMVRWAVGVLRSAGLRPAIAMRGYGAAAGAMSDEQAEHRASLPDVPIAAHRSRAAAIRAMLRADPSIDCIVLDDGFQHRAVRRRVDIVLIDATRNPFDDRHLPAGWLREPPTALGRTHALVVTRAESVTPAALDALTLRLRAVAPAAHLAVARHRWTHLDGGTGPMDVSALEGKRVHVVCGIGNPDAFIAQARAAGAVVNSADVRPDHASYERRRLAIMLRRAAATRCDYVLTTPKDWVKIGPLLAAAQAAAIGTRPHGLRAQATPPVLRPALQIVFDEGESGLTRLMIAACRVGPAQPRTDVPATGAFRPLLP